MAKLSKLEAESQLYNKTKLDLFNAIAACKKVIDLKYDYYRQIAEQTSKVVDEDEVDDIDWQLTELLDRFVEIDTEIIYKYAPTIYRKERKAK